MIGSLGFLAPWMLVALAVLPLIWLLLRLIPPRPRLVQFPPTRLLLDLEDKDRTSARTPWWLTAIRLALVTMLILALAEPVLRPDAKLTTGDGPLLVLLDNGWDAAPDFAERVAAAEATIAEAAREGRP
ncbi:MAG: BatA domain-containing protein, partial [Propylenella sp.]